jgi:hypothetical protein
LFHAALRFFELARVLVRFDHAASAIVNANHSGVRPPSTRYSGLIIFFCVDGVEILGLRFFGSDCEYSRVGRSGAERRLLGKLPILEKNTKKATKMVDIFVLMFGVSELPNSLKLQIVAIQFRAEPGTISIRVSFESQ